MARGRLSARCTRILALAALAGLGCAAHAEIELRAVRVEASYTFDDNVPRASAGEALKDGILGARASAGLVVPVSERTRAVFQGFGGVEKFQKYKGLSQTFAGGQGDFQLRSTGEFAAATYSLHLRTQAEFYESNLRDGYRHAFGFSVLKPITDRVQFFGAIQRNIGDGKSVVFDTKNTSLRGTLDWSPSRWDTVYLGAEYRRGDIVSSGTQSLARVSTADAVVQDDAFTDQGYFAYRLQANTGLATLGYSHAFAEKQALDISWRYVLSKPLHPSGYGSASDIRYSVSQLSIAYLMRF